MNRRFVLNLPSGEQFRRDVVDGIWVEAEGSADDTVGEGLFALPGLVDAHAHFAQTTLGTLPGDLEGAKERAREALAAGVTLALDKGWMDTTTIDMMDAVPPSERPEIEAAAVLITAHGGYYEGFAREVDGLAIDTAVREEARSGRGWVKLVGDWPRKGVGPQPNFSLEELTTAVTVAESEGARVAIHTMAPDVPSLAVEAGVHSIEHGLFLTEPDIAKLGERAGMWVPTVLRAEALLSMFGETSSGGKLFESGLANVASLLPFAIEAGVHVLAGTDLVGTAADVADEALRLGEYGLSNEQIVGAVSTSGFSATGRPSAFELGAVADAVFFTENPVTAPGVLRHPSHVLRLGRLS